MKNLLFFVLALCLVAPASAQDTDHPAQVPILVGAALPSYPAIWRAAHLSGKIVVRVIIRNGQVSETDVIHGESHLDIPTLANLKTWSFDSDVNTSITVTYTYLISGKPTDGPTNPTIQMTPSLDVKITARPVRPTINYGK